MKTLLPLLSLLFVACAHQQRAPEPSEGGGGFVPGTARIVTKSLLAQAVAPVGSPSASLSQFNYVATAPQGTADSPCLVSGGTGTTGVCLGGYPGAGFNALFLGVTPSTRTASQRALLSNGTSTWMNAPSSSGAVNFELGGATQWSIESTSLRPQSDNAENIGAQSIAMANVYSWIYSSRLNAQFVAFASPTASATSTSAPAFLFRQTTNTLDANDLLLDVQDLNNVSRFKVDIEGDATIAGSLNATGEITSSNYIRANRAFAGAPTAADCDIDAERGRITIDSTNNRLYICNGATRGWDYIALTD